MLPPGVRQDRLLRLAARKRALTRVLAFQPCTGVVLPGILRQNTQTVVGFVTVLVLVFLVANLIVDLLYAVLDPRIRYA